MGKGSLLFSQRRVRDIIILDGCHNYLAAFYAPSAELNVVCYKSKM